MEQLASVMQGAIALIARLLLAAIFVVSAVANKIAFKNMVRATKAGLTWDTEGLKKHLELNITKNKKQTGYHTTGNQHFGITPTSLPQGLFTDLLDA